LAQIATAESADPGLAVPERPESPAPPEHELELLGLDPEGRRGLLAEYFGVVREQDAYALEVMRFMSDFREAMWGVVQSAVSTLDFDFDSYSAEHFERLERTAAEPVFQPVLET